MGAVTMKRKNERRSFFKRLLSLAGIGTFSLLSFKIGGNLPNQKSGLFRLGVPNARAAASGSGTKKIAVEEHARLSELDHLEKRLEDMDSAGIQMQVVSLALDDEGHDAASSMSAARAANERLSEMVAKYPDRFAGYATIPMLAPDDAPRELERAVKKLGLKAPLVFAGKAGGYVDERRYWGIFETAAALDVPVYIHPGNIMQDMRAPYLTYPILSYAMWGFAAATGLHAMRLICSGIFDAYPNLKIMLGHLGEGIPYWLWRMDKHYVSDRPLIAKDAPGNDLRKKPSEYFKENFYVTTSGMCWHPVLQFVNSVLGADRIMFAADYPPESALEAAEFIDSAPLNAVEREKICHLNAEKLLRL
jgi:2,3-dihydroxybenzoate decarboxylase